MSNSNMKILIYLDVDDPKPVYKKISSYYSEVKVQVEYANWGKVICEGFNNNDIVANKVWQLIDEVIE